MHCLSTLCASIHPSHPIALLHHGQSRVDDLEQTSPTLESKLQAITTSHLPPAAARLIFIMPPSNQTNPPHARSPPPPPIVPQSSLARKLQPSPTNAIDTQHACISFLSPRVRVPPRRPIPFGSTLPFPRLVRTRPLMPVRLRWAG